MPGMQILFIGGTGNISTACSRAALAAGHALTVLTRGRRALDLPGAAWLVADIADESATQAALAGRTFDVVVNFIAFTVEHIERDLRLFTGRCGQYLFISSASCYTKPLPLPVREDSPLGNPLWEYSQRKVACEQRLWQAQEASGLNVTIVRPSHTYDTIIPLAFGGGGDWTGCARMLAGKPMIVPGDGTSIWTVTHSDDVASALLGLYGNPQAFGQAFHITGDEWLTWAGIHHEVAAVLEVTANLVPITSAAIIAKHPHKLGSLLGDKSHSAIFDNAKIKRAVPGWSQRVPFATGIRRTLAWFQADPQRLTIRPETEAEIEEMLALVPLSARAGS